MYPKILVSYPIPSEGLQPLHAKAQLVYPPHNKAFDRAELLHHIPSCDGLLSVFNQEIDAEIIRAAPKLKIIANYGVGYNNINIALAKNLGIVVCNTPDPVTEPTAELTLGLIINLLRKTNSFEQALRKGQYPQWDMLHNLGHSLHGKTLGIVGLGKIGKSVAHKARAFGMEVIYYQRRRMAPADETNWEVRYTPFEQLLQQSDVVSLHVPLTHETYRMIGTNELSMMKPQAYLVNTARGAVVNEPELFGALKNRVIAGAALDVFENEPNPHPGLLALDNLVALPHIGTQTYEARIGMGLQASQNLLDFFEGRAPKNRVI